MSFTPRLHEFLDRPGIGSGNPILQRDALVKPAILARQLAVGHLADQSPVFLQLHEVQGSRGAVQFRHFFAIITIARPAAGCNLTIDEQDLLGWRWNWGLRSLSPKFLSPKFLLTFRDWWTRGGTEAGATAERRRKRVCQTC